MRRGCGVLLVVCALLATWAMPLGAAVKPPPKPVLVYGDSLVWESLGVVAGNTASHKVAATVIGGPAQAPCDWLATLDSDLAKYKPVVVELATAGNSFFPCMYDPATGQPWPMGSAGYYARYRSDLNTFFSKVTASGAAMVFAEDPPMLDSTRNAAVVQIIAIATSLAGQYHGVSLAKNTRTTVANGSKYTSYKKCLKGETAAEGCSGGLIAVRTVSGDPAQIGLHLCPQSLDFPDPCPVYSSGEKRFGNALSASVEHPPKPVLP